MKRILLILGLMSLPIIAKGQIAFDSTIGVSAAGFTVGTISGSAIWASDICDTMWLPKKDTTRWYIKEVKEKCDTSYLKTYLPANISGDFYSEIYTREIKCKTDTTWAEKLEVWLRPEQLERLTKILEAWKN